MPGYGSDQGFTDWLAAGVRKSCSVANCGRPAARRTWCATHYRRWLTHGDISIVKSLPNGTCANWLAQNVGHTGNDCLIWPFSRKETGYAQINIRGKTVHASREMCRLAHGEPTHSSMDAAHSCGKGHLGCVNPQHLRWATRSENLRDKAKHGTHNRGETIGCAVLTEEKVMEIAKIGRRLSERAIARQYGVHRSTINGILAGRSWGWLTGLGGGNVGIRV